MIAGEPGPERLVCPSASKADLVLKGVLRQFDRVLAAAVEAFAAPDRSPLTPDVLLDLHRCAVRGVYACAGQFRDHEVKVGPFHLPPAHEQVPGLVDAMCDYVRERWEEQTPVELSAFVMWRVNWIHPFGGGSGRTSRAASYLVMIARHGGLIPGKTAIPNFIAEGRRTDYLAALRDADAAWARSAVVDVSRLADLLAELLISQIGEDSSSGS